MDLASAYVPKEVAVDAPGIDTGTFTETRGQRACSLAGHALSVRPHAAMSNAARAYAFAESLANGFVTPTEVIPWIDGVLLDREDPDSVLLDAALAKDDRNRLIELLHTFGACANQTEVAEYLFEDMAAALSRDPALCISIGRTLYQMALNRHWPHPDAETQMYYFDDAFDLARREMHGDVATIRAELHDFLRRFKRSA